MKSEIVLWWRLKHLWNVDRLVADYMTQQQPRRQPSSNFYRVWLVLWLPSTCGSCALDSGCRRWLENRELGFGWLHDQQSIHSSLGNSRSQSSVTYLQGGWGDILLDSLKVSVLSCSIRDFIWAEIRRISVFCDFTAFKDPVFGKSIGLDVRLHTRHLNDFVCYFICLFKWV
jgi:hypothetical protein